MFLADRAQSFSQLIGDSFRSFKPLWTKLLPIFIVMWVVDTILGGAAGLSTALFSGVTDPQAGMNLTGVSFVAVLSVFILIFANVYFFIVKLNRTDGVLSGDSVKASSAWRSGWSRWFPMIGLLVILTFFFIMLSIATSILVPTLIIVSGWLSALFGIFMFFVYLYLAVKLFFVYPLVASRNVSVFTALAKTFRLTRGYFWRLIGMYIVVVIIPGIILGGLGYFVATIVPNPEFMNVCAIVMSIVVHFVVTTLWLGATYVFLNDSLHRHGALRAD